MYIRIYWKVIGWSFFMLLIFLAPASDLPEGPELPHMDKLAHIVVFAIFTILLYQARIKHKGIRVISFSLILNLLIYTMVFGAAIELAQSFMGLGREGNIYDLISDLAGYFLGFISIFIYTKIF
jgi:VanZ family protein